MVILVRLVLAVTVAQILSEVLTDIINSTNTFGDYSRLTSGVRPNLAAMPDTPYFIQSE